MSIRLSTLCGASLLVAGLALQLPVAAQVPTFSSVQHVGAPGGAGTSYSEVLDMETDAQGNSYVRGKFYGTVQFGGFTLTPPVGVRVGAYLAKLDRNGNYLWVQQHRVFDWARRSMTLDAAGNLYLTTSYRGNNLSLGGVQLTSADSANTKLVVFKINPNGTCLWGRQVAGTCSIVANSLAVDANDNVYLTGAFGPGSIQIGSNTLVNTNSSSIPVSNAFVAKLSAGGTWLWGAQSEQLVYSNHGDYANSVAVDAAGDVYITGSVSGTSVGMGNTTLSNPSLYTSDAFVAKLSTGGAWQWAHRIGGMGYDEGSAVAIDRASGNVYVYGMIQGNDANSYLALTPSSGDHELFIAQLTPAGAPVWARTAGGVEAEVAGGMTLDMAGNAYLTGWYGSATAAFGSTQLTNTSQSSNHNVFVAKIDAAGQWQWAQAAEGSYIEEGLDVGTDNSGAVWAVGTAYSGTTNFGSQVLTGVYPWSYGYIAQITDGQILTVASVAPSSGSPGQTVTITGTNLSGVTGVEFGGVPATSFSVLSSTSVRATVPAGARSGAVTVRTASRTSVGGVTFQLTPLATTSVWAATVGTWPNPIGRHEALQVAVPVAAPRGAAHRLSLATLQGRTVLEHDFTGLRTGVSVRHLAPGLYVLTLRAAGEAPVVRRIVVQ